MCSPGKLNYKKIISNNKLVLVSIPEHHRRKGVKDFDLVIGSLLNLNLIYATLWAGAGTALLISVLEKFDWFLLTGLITVVLLMWKWMVLYLRKNHILRCWV